MSEPQKSAVQLRLEALFTEARTCENSHDIVRARKLERQVARLVARVAKEQPESAELADALSMHEYTLLSLSRTSARADVQKRFKDLAYKTGAQAVDIRLRTKRDLGCGFSAYNLAIDLIMSENRPAEGLHYMLEARKVLKALPANQLPRNYDFFMKDYGIAKAYHDLGDLDAAVKAIKRGLRGTGVLKVTRSWHGLRALGKCISLLGDFELELLQKRKEAEKAK
jgi:hypothetical protein